MNHDKGNKGGKREGEVVISSNARQLVGLDSVSASDDTKAV